MKKNQVPVKSETASQIEASPDAADEIRIHLLSTPI